MQALSKGFSSLPLFIRIIVVSHPESDIQGALGSHLDVRPYTLDNKSTTIKDVLEFVHHHLEEICEEDGYLNADWPVDYKTNALANVAGGLFIWASTACLYIQGHDPDRRLTELNDKQSESNSSNFLMLTTTSKSGDLWVSRIRSVTSVREFYLLCSYPYHKPTPTLLKIPNAHVGGFGWPCNFAAADQPNPYQGQQGAQKSAHARGTHEGK